MFLVIGHAFLNPPWQRLLAQSRLWILQAFDLAAAHLSVVWKEGHENPGLGTLGRNAEHRPARRSRLADSSQKHSSEAVSGRLGWRTWFGARQILIVVMDVCLGIALISDIGVEVEDEKIVEVK